MRRALEQLSEEFGDRFMYVKEAFKETGLWPNARVLLDRPRKLFDIAYDLMEMAIQELEGCEVVVEEKLCRRVCDG